MLPGRMKKGLLTVRELNQRFIMCAEKKKNMMSPENTNAREVTETGNAHVGNIR
jgi:hypothetical protein